jgi:zinc transport system substrate-binding protein
MPRILLSSLVLLHLILPSVLAAAPLRVFVSVLPLQTLVERVGGEGVAVEVLVGPGHSPATYEPSPQQMAALAEAQVFLRIGVPFERAWMDRIAAANPQLRVVDGRDGMALREVEDHHGHSHEALDPHVWTDPQRVRILVARLAEVLAELRPAQAERLRANAVRLDAELAELDGELRQTLACVQDRRFLVFHPAWGYLADRYGLEQVVIEVEGKEPGARTLAALIDRARALGLRRVLVQPQFSSRGAAVIAQALDGQLVVADPLAPDLLANLRRVARTIAAGCTP